MKNLKKLIVVMLMMASVFFIACEETAVNDLTPEQAKSELSNLDTEMSGYVDEMTNSEGLEAMDMLLNMPDPFVTGKATGRTSVIPNIRKYLLPVNPEKTKSTYEAEPFDFDTWVGTYTYHNTPFPYWEIVPGGDKIELNFPTDENNMGTNDATITIYNYDEVYITSYDDSLQTYKDDYYPTDILADLYIHSIKIVEIDMEATWIATGDAAGDPSSFDISVYLTPFTFTGNFSNTNSDASIDFAINYDNTRIFSAGVNATFQNNNIDDPLTVGGYVQLLNVKVEADVDVKGINAIITAIDDGTTDLTTMEEFTDALNAEIDAVVYVDGVKAADIEIQYDEATEDAITVVFVYSDGSTEPAEPYFDNFSTEIEDFFFFLDDIYGDW